MNLRSDEACASGNSSTQVKLLYLEMGELTEAQAAVSRSSASTAQSQLICGWFNGPAGVGTAYLYRSISKVRQQSPSKWQSIKVRPLEDIKE